MFPPVLSPPAWRQRLQDPLSAALATSLLPALCVFGYWLGGERALLGLALGAPMLMGLAWLFGHELETSFMGRQPTDPERLDARLGQLASPAHGISRWVSIVCFDFEPEDPRQVALYRQKLNGLLRLHDEVFFLSSSRIAVLSIFNAQPQHDDLLSMAFRCKIALGAATHLDDKRIAPIGIVISPIGANIGALRQQAETNLNQHIQINGADSTSLEAIMSPVLAGAHQYKVDTTPSLRYAPILSTDTGEIEALDVTHALRPNADTELLAFDDRPIVKKHCRLKHLSLDTLAQDIASAASVDQAFPPVLVRLDISANDPTQGIQRLLKESLLFGIAPKNIGFVVPAHKLLTARERPELPLLLEHCSEQGLTIQAELQSPPDFDLTDLSCQRITHLRLGPTFTQRIDRIAARRAVTALLLQQAEAAGLTTIGTDVSTDAEHAELAQLGCRCVTGPRITHPLSAEAFTAWAHLHETKLASLPHINQRWKS